MLRGGFNFRPTAFVALKLETVWLITDKPYFKNDGHAVFLQTAVSF
ncbi:MAG: hypothetical protein GY847_29445 [Proteobacteria bacterium]|nr:hypothetical protein [Pseudomonadota bacterium]